jgi:Flp pilus assembly protein TadD
VHRLILTLLLLADPGYDQLLRDGLAALEANQTQQARVSLERAVKLNANGGEAWAALAETYFKLNFAVSARTAATRAEALARTQPLLLRQLANYYEIAAGSRDRDAVLRAVSLRLEAKQARLAIPLAVKGLAAGDRADLRGLLARAYLADGQHARAINEYNRAILLDPYEEQYYFELGQLLIDQENYTTAVQVLEAGEHIFDKSAQIELALGGAYYGLKKYEEAGFAFLKTVTLAPQAPQPYTFLGRLLDQNTRWLPEITQAFAAFAENQPRQYLPQFLYGKALLVGGKDLPEAEARLHKSIVLEDRFWEAHFQLGILLEKKADLGGAEKELKRAAVLAPENPLPHQELARVFDHMGKPAEARVERLAAEKLAGAVRPATAARRSARP